MGELNVTANMADLTPNATDGVFVDKETGYSCQIWQQRSLWGDLPYFLVLYLHKGRWKLASAQLTDRMLRRARLPGIHDCPWGPGPELIQSMDDAIEAAGGAPNMGETLRSNI